MKNKLIASKLSISEETSESKENMAEYFHLQQKGLHLTSKGKVAIILLVDDSDRHGWLDDSNLFDSESAESSPCSQLETLVSDYQNSVKVYIYIYIIVILRFHLLLKLLHLYWLVV